MSEQEHRILLTNPEENPKERVDRELSELLQGLRVQSTGVQVLFAFLLTLPFSAGFSRVDEFGKWLFYAALVSAAVASICLLAPAVQNRILFRSGLKEIMLHRANELAVVGGIALAVSMTCSTGLVVEVYLGATPAILIAAGVVLLSTWLWFVQPLLTLQRNRGRIADS
ncbi:hypothetical protein GT755_24485 [Herbidospora sp. NEAU-GS84]|uniref:Sodium:proton antiporter n=1 Tax=Herbidospora solisilvae TaxID=2696284 RepID=A0A7C9MZH1_9ACTN|nr:MULTISPECIES: DUF6328 family protein [Herbidospora]NAS24831.1 hypothetical protein [Herbidospora solisilvae]GLX97723.1 hypothetical protein Hesp01_56730 [Herbidospora sp. NBRC 101105]